MTSFSSTPPFEKVATHIIETTTPTITTKGKGRRLGP